MQLSYTQDVAAGLEGQIATAYPHSVVTGLCTADVPAGTMVAHDPAGAATESMKRPAAGGDVNRPLAAGFAVLDHMVETGQDRPANRPFGVLKKGHIWLRPETAVTKDSLAFVRHTAAGAEKLGAVRADADSGDATQCTGVIFRQTVSAGEICLVEVDL